MSTHQTPGGETEREACPNCRELTHPCACMRNKCNRCGEPVGNITFTVCDQCWDETHRDD